MATVHVHNELRGAADVQLTVHEEVKEEDATSKNDTLDTRNDAADEVKNKEEDATSKNGAAPAAPAAVAAPQGQARGKGDDGQKGKEKSCPFQALHSSRLGAGYGLGFVGHMCGVLTMVILGVIGWPHMVHSHAVHLALGALLIWCTVWHR